MDLYERFLEETQDSEKEYIRYISKDIPFLKELKERYRDDWQMEELISSLIHDELLLMEDCAERWNNARRQKEEFKRLQRAGSDNIESRNEIASGAGNLFMDRSQKQNADT